MQKEEFINKFRKDEITWGKLMAEIKKKDKNTILEIVSRLKNKHKHILFSPVKSDEVSEERETT